MSNSNITSRILTGATVVALVFALNVSGALAGFWRTIDGISDAGVPNPMEFLFGYGTDGNVFGYGYGYGYGEVNGPFEAGEIEAADSANVGGGFGTAGGTTTTSSSSTSGGGSSSTSSSSTSGGGSSSTSSSSTSGGGSSSTSSSSTSGGGTDGGTDNGAPTTEGLKYRDYSNQPRLATCGTSIVNFSDIAGNTFEDYIIRLEKRSGLNGNGNGTSFNIYTAAGTTFEPNRTATRSEFVKMILRALCIDYSGENETLDDFNDTGVDVWQAKVVNKAAELGLIDTRNANFNVNMTINRAEALKLVMRAGIADAFTDVPATSSFTDVAVGSWQSKYTEMAVKNGIIAPNPTFRPMNAITRGESSKFILNALNVD